MKGLWARLAYVAHLRDDKGEYMHWGLMRCHGDDSARSAIREVHEGVYAELLRTPVSQSLKELRTSALAAGQKSYDYIERFGADETDYVPTSMLKRTQRHFLTVVATLRTLLQHDESLGS